MLVILSGVSGSGKDTIKKALISKLDNVESFISFNEDEELNNELSILENVEKLKEHTGTSYWALSGDDNSIINSLYQIKTTLSKASGLDNNLENDENELINAIEILKEVSANLRDYSSSLENDTERINEIQERLFTIDKLKRKYGGSIENVIKTGEKLRNELNNIEFSNITFKSFVSFTFTPFMFVKNNLTCLYP